jgi:hypothetical protein
LARRFNFPPDYSNHISLGSQRLRFPAGAAF